HFVSNYKPGALRQERIVKVQFLAQLLQIFGRIAAFASGNVDHEEKNSAARDVSKEFVTESKPAVRAFNQTGNVRDRRASIFRKFHHTDDRMQRGEGIGRNSWTCRGDFSKQR